MSQGSKDAAEDSTCHDAPPDTLVVHRPVEVDDRTRPLNLLDRSMFGKLTQNRRVRRRPKPAIEAQTPRIVITEVHVPRATGEVHVDGGSVRSHKTPLASNHSGGSTSFLPFLKQQKSHSVSLLDPQSFGVQRSPDLVTMQEHTRRSRIDAAQEHMKKMKALRREDSLMELAPVITDTRQLSANTVISETTTGSEIAEVQAGTPICKNAESSEDKPGKLQNLPPVYKFPSVDDFISPGKPNWSRDMGVSWRIHDGRGRGQGGKLCSSLYPMAEALRRAGTAPEIVRGKSLGKGDWNVMMVWPRRLRGIAPAKLPIQMAREDTIPPKVIIGPIDTS